MTVLNCILMGIFGGFAGLFPVSISGHFVFFGKVNTTLSGVEQNFFGNDVLFFICLGILCVLSLFYLEKLIPIFKNIKNREYIETYENGILKEILMYLIFYIPPVINMIFFENSSFNNIIFSVFLCLNVVAVFASDFMEKPILKDKGSLYTYGIATLIGGFSGMSEIAALFLVGILSGKKPAKSMDYGLFLYIPLLFIRTLVYFVKALVTGFGFNFLCYLLIFIFTLITSLFALGLLRKTASKRNFRYFAYYMTIFTVIAIYTFIKG